MSVLTDQQTARLTYWHIYADDEGISHFRQSALSFNPAPVPGLDDPPLAATLSEVSGATFLRLAPSQVEDWHPAPRRVFLVVISGISEVTVGDGTVKRFGPGDVVLMDDTSGAGHVTRSVGEDEHIALVIDASAPAG